MLKNYLNVANIRKSYLKLGCFLLLNFGIAAAQPELAPIQVGAERTQLYLPLLKDKRVGLITNQAARVNQLSVLDFLRQQHVNVVKLFTPEHGFSVAADAGTAVRDTQHQSVTIISLYGSKLQPSAQDLADVDILVFDLQDVGVRFYTYISTLQKILEAAQGKPVIIFDRPNPNAAIIDGPVLERHYTSFVGMQPVPLVYGMTIGEYARMLVGQHWLANKHNSKSKPLNLTIIPLANYTHQRQYSLPTWPSPNLNSMTAIYLYPSLGWFEGTKLSVGRGTLTPFQMLGAPNFVGSFQFTPIARLGALTPPYLQQQCQGLDLRMSESQAYAYGQHGIHLELLINAYRVYPQPKEFFTPYFDKLAGSNRLRLQIQQGWSESEIRASWQPQLQNFRNLRRRYLLYPE